MRFSSSSETLTAGWSRMNSWAMGGIWSRPNISGAVTVRSPRGSDRSLAAELELLELRQGPAARSRWRPPASVRATARVVRLKRRVAEAIFRAATAQVTAAGSAQMPGRGDEAAPLGNGDKNGEFVEAVHQIIAQYEIDSVVLRLLNQKSKLFIFGSGYEARSEMSGFTDKHLPPTLWHAGERALQASVGLGREKMDRIGRAVLRDFMTEQHRDFFAELPFVILGSIDAEGMPAASLLAGPPGFIASPDPRRLDIATCTIPGDPLLAALKPGAPVGLLGIELWTRRRNRMNGHVIAADARGFSVAVDQSFGNCPQYIQRRDYLLRRERVRSAGRGFRRAGRGAPAR